MSTNDEIRRKLGGDLPHEPVNMADMAFSVREIKPVDQRKQADEQCQGVNGELLKGIVLGAGDSTVMNGVRVTNSGPVPFTLHSVDLPDRQPRSVWNADWDAFPWGEVTASAHPGPFRELEEAVERMTRIGVLK